MPDNTNKIISLNDLWMIYNLPSHIVAVLTPDGKFEHVNNAFASTLGYWEEHVVGNPFQSFVHANDEAKGFAAFQMLSEKDNCECSKLRMRTSSGSYKLLSWSFTQPAGSPFVYAVGHECADDMTVNMHAKKVSEFGKIKPGTALENGPIPRLLFDTASLQVLRANDAAIRQYGYSAVEFCKINLYDLHSQEQPDAIERLINELTEDNHQVSHLLHRKQNGEIMQVKATFSKVLYNKKPVLMGIFENVSDNYVANQRLLDQADCLREIAWKQSHLMRCPLVNLKSLFLLFKEDPGNMLFLNFMESELEKLDNVIKEMVLQAASTAALDQQTLLQPV